MPVGAGMGLSPAQRVEGSIGQHMRMSFCGGLVLAALISCGGPHEQAGEHQDQAAANATGQDYSGSGPAQRVGRAQDRADRAAIDAQQATKDAVAAESENYRRQVEVGAVRLEEQARELRENADRREDELEAEAAEAAKK